MLMATTESGRLISILYNVVGGIIVALLTILSGFAYRVLRHRCFRRLLGLSSKETLHVVYSLYQPERTYTFKKPQTRVHRDTPGGYNLAGVVSSANARSISYLSSWAGQAGGASPTVVDDVTVGDTMDISFVSIGGTNHKTRDILADPENRFVVFDRQDGRAVFVVPAENGSVIARAESDYDYGILVKLHPHARPARSWICCAGFGEWGTSGAAWFLAHHWRTIYADFGTRPFAYVLKTRVGADDSTELLWPPASPGFAARMWGWAMGCWNRVRCAFAEVCSTLGRRPHHR
jgi:hypothetical protein